MNHIVFLLAFVVSGFVNVTCARNSANEDKHKFSDDHSNYVNSPNNIGQEDLLDSEVKDDFDIDDMEDEQKLKMEPWWGRRRRRRRRHSSKRVGGCRYLWWKFQCSDRCCWRITKKVAECLPCRWKFNLPCGKYLNPPNRGPTLSTAYHARGDQSNWMRRFQHRRLKEMIFPGSHHTGINVKPGGHLLDSWDIPQTMSVKNQLKSGVRFFDVRVATGPLLRQPSITHNYKYQDFEFLIKDTARFLRHHPNEVVVMVLSKGKKDANYYGVKISWTTNWRYVDRVLARYRRYVYTGGNPLNKQLRQLRGKLIVCQKQKQSSFYAMRCEGSWGYTRTNNPHTLTARMGHWVNTRPWYSSSVFYFLEAILTPTKTDITRSINPFACKRSGNQALYKYKSLKDLASTANYYIYHWLKNRNIRGKVRAVMTDFVNPVIVNRIIRMN